MQETSVDSAASSISSLLSENIGLTHHRGSFLGDNPIPFFTHLLAYATPFSSQCIFFSVFRWKCQYLRILQQYHLLKQSYYDYSDLNMTCKITYNNFFIWVKNLLFDDFFKPSFSKSSSVHFLRLFASSFLFFRFSNCFAYTCTSHILLQFWTYYKRHLSYLIS